MDQIVLSTKEQPPFYFTFFFQRPIFFHLSNTTIYPFQGQIWKGGDKKEPASVSFFGKAVIQKNPTRKHRKPDARDELR